MAEFVLVLSCGHVIPDNHKSDVSALCPRHMQHMEIVDRNKGYSWKCYSCGTSRGTGLAIMLARHKADAHRRKYPTHRTCIKLGNSVIEGAGFAAQPMLPFESVTKSLPIEVVDLPPF